MKREDKPTVDGQPASSEPAVLLSLNGERIGVEDAADAGAKGEFEDEKARSEPSHHTVRGTKGWDHLSSASAPLLAPPRKSSVLAVSAMVVLIATAIVWAHFASLEEITRGDGRVIPASKIQVVQNLEGGIVRAIRTKVGDRVKKGQVLFRIDATSSGSSLDERLERIAGMEAKVARLSSEVSGSALVFPKQLMKTHPELVKQERHLYQIRRREYVAAVNVLTQQIAQKQQEIDEAQSQSQFSKQILKKVREEIAFTRPLLKSKLASKVDFIKLETRELELQRDIKAAELKAAKAAGAVEEARQRLSERQNRFKGDSLSELNKVQVDLAALKNEVRAFQDRFARTEVRSPVDGIVKDVKVTSMGQVVKPGMDLAEIVPVEDSLLVEANVKPADIAFLRPGLPATVKITAYDYTIYGSLDAKVAQIGADTFTDDKGNSFYRIQVRTKKSYLTKGNKRLPIIPGMIAQVDIRTGEKSVLEYILKPFNKMLNQSMTER